MAQQDPASYEWLTWLSGRDAQMLLNSLMVAIEEETMPISAVRSMIQQWRVNAHQALTNEDWTAVVDGYLEVKVDARLFVFRTGQDGYARRGHPLENQ